jgi:hypothetical protein
VSGDISVGMTRLFLWCCWCARAKRGNGQIPPVKGVSKIPQSIQQSRQLYRLGIDTETPPFAGK